MGIRTGHHRNYVIDADVPECLVDIYRCFVGKWIASLGDPFDEAVFPYRTAVCVVDDFGNLVRVPS
jgi:hypothetical protein